MRYPRLPSVLLELIVISVAVLVRVIPLPGISDFNEKLGFVDDADNSELPVPVDASEMLLAGDALFIVISFVLDVIVIFVPPINDFNLKLGLVEVRFTILLPVPVELKLIKVLGALFVNVTSVPDDNKINQY